MSEQQHHHHHHHHHYHEDDAARFKRLSLSSIENRKKIAKWVWRVLCVIAIIMFIIVVVIYKLK